MALNWETLSVLLTQSAMRGAVVSNSEIFTDSTETHTCTGRAHMPYEVVLGGA